MARTTTRSTPEVQQIPLTPTTRATNTSVVTRRFILAATLILTLVWVDGCTKDRPPRPVATPTPAAPAKAPDGAGAEHREASEAAEAGRKARGPLDVTVEAFEALLTAVEPCKISSRGIARDCEAYVAFRKAKQRRGPISRSWRVVDRELAVRHLAHEDAAVRFVAAELMEPLIGATAETLRPLVAATRREVHPGVVKSFVRRMGSSTYRNPEVRALMMVLAGHLDLHVRIDVGSILTAGPGRGTPDILERAMKMATDDPSERVRLQVIEDLGDQGDDRILPFLERFLGAPERSERAHASALRALINMWSSPVPQPTVSKAAYRRTMKFLEQTPRSEASPPWTALGGLRWIADERFKARATFFERKRFLAALDAIVVDRAANPRARKAIVEVLIAIGAEHARFERLLANYAKGAATEADDPVVNLLRGTIDGEASKLKPAPLPIPVAPTTP